MLIYPCRVSLIVGLRLRGFWAAGLESSWQLGAELARSLAALGMFTQVRRGCSSCGRLWCRFCCVFMYATCLSIIVYPIETPPHTTTASGHLPTPRQHGHSPQRHAAAGTAAPTHHRHVWTQASDMSFNPPGGGGGGSVRVTNRARVTRARGRAGSLSRRARRVHAGEKD